MLLCIGCQWQLRQNAADDDSTTVSIQRFDRIESLFLTTGDYSALQQMNTSYPMQTRMLIEDMLKLGHVNDSDINTKFFHFFQDSTLQGMLTDVKQQYASLDDVNEQLSGAFRWLKEQLPGFEMPSVYAQVGSFDQSIIVGHRTLGISLDKYLGEDYPFYRTHYTPGQRKLMTREMIVPDCLGFYILSLFPMPNRDLSQQDRDRHMGKIQWIVNQATQRNVFQNDYVAAAAQYMKHHTIEQLLGGSGDSE
jgi:hypothetical protein